MALVEIALLDAGSLFGLGALAISLSRRPQATALVYGATIALAGGLVLTGLAVLVGGGPVATVTLPVGLPWLGALFRLDPLAAFFLVLVGLGSAAASLFAMGHAGQEPEPGRILPFYPPFLGAMTVVILADDAFTFLMSWEAMSLLSWALVLVNHRDAGVRNAGFVYLSMASFGTMALLLGFGMLAGVDGGYAFDMIRTTERSAAATALALLLVLLGTGSKAGLFPLHVWLPLAHPSAPSHVSALMSGVMTKVALYGLIRVSFDLLGPVAWWMSPLLILLGAMTAVMGILLATVDGDAKRVLAFSTIENIGVIVAALGLAMAFRANGMDLLAALALTTALFHAFNHMLFKSLLFMVAGAVLKATGQHDLDRLGGLIHRMPRTAVLALIGVTAIAALPPLNGFASEWLLFQAVLQSPALPQPALKFVVPAAGGLLALSAALAAACFARFYGVVFLGRPRSDAAADATETDRASLTAMSGLAGLCVLAGVLSGAVLDLIAPAVMALLGAQIAPQGSNPWLTVIPVAEVQSSYSGFLVLVFMAFSASCAAWAVHRFASKRLRRAPAWDCGFPNADPATQYGAGSFAQPIRRVLGTTLLASREAVVMPPPGDLSPARHSVHSEDLAWSRLFVPAAESILALATRLNALQFLTIRRYLGLVFVSLIFLLVGLAVWN